MTDYRDGMIINNIDKIDSDGGRFIVLSDYGCEGFSVSSQHERIEDAICALCEMGSNQAIVCLPDLKLVVTAHDDQEDKHD